MDDSLLTIGAFARAVGLSPSALRFYDECGLLVPAQVDAATGYRYYTPELARRAELVVGMREAGVPVATMRVVLDGPTEDGVKALQEFLDTEALRRARAEEALGDVLDRVGAEHPSVPASVRIEGPVLAAALRQVLPAAESDPTSPLAGVLIDVEDGRVDVVATNRYWMAVRSPSADASGDPARTILAAAEAIELGALLDAQAQVDVRIGEGRLTCERVGDRAWGSGLAYPAHRMVLAGVPVPVTCVVVPAAGLLAALEHAARAEVDLFLHADGVDVAGAVDPTASLTVPATVNGPEISLRMGSRLLARAVEASLGPTAVIEISAPDRPVVLRSPYQSDLRILVMPIARGGAVAGHAR